MKWKGVVIVLSKECDIGADANEALLVNKPSYKEISVKGRPSLFNEMKAFCRSIDKAITKNDVTLIGFQLVIIWVLTTC